jgi:asparagine synthase (glutamine-hydrolysing)
MLAAISQWGLEAALKQFVGMFAFGLWDLQERTLYLARDRVGEKPLYYGWSGDVFLFGSELKALRAHPAWRGEVNRGALALFLRHGYVPEPYSIYSGISKLTPGTFFSLPLAAARPGELPTPAPFWSMKSVAEAGMTNPFKGTDSEAVGSLDTLLRRAVGQQMVADVPLGAFLSGGIDSSTVVALMQVQSNRPIKTFSIGFCEDDYNEAEHAKSVAKHLGTDHTELYVTPKEAMSVIPKLPAIYDEPFADSSQIPTYLVARLARQKVTVSLSGDGGDELFGGYTRYFTAERIWRRIRWVPRWGRIAAATALRQLSTKTLERVLGWAARFAVDQKWRGRTGHRFEAARDILAVRSPEQLYLRLISQWKNPNDIVIDGTEPSTIMTNPAKWPRVPGFFQRMMFLDTVCYLPSDILLKVDRATMAVSLESRVPLLDHRIIEFASSVPLSMKVRNGQGKWLLRQVLCQYVPTRMIDRPKMGFGVPIDAWLRGPLRDWGEHLVEDRRLRAEGFFHDRAIREKWQDHLAGRRDWHFYLWNVLMFQAWLEQQKSISGTPVGQGSLQK